MSLNITAQDYLIVQPQSTEVPEENTIEVVDTEEPTSSDKVIPLEVSTDEINDVPIEVEIKLEGDLPGALFSPEILEVHDEEKPIEVEDSNKIDENDTKKSKKNEKWDWESRGHEGFLTWIKERFDSVPKHSGYDSAGLERAVAYLEKLDSEISKAMRLDVDGNLDANKIEDIRSKIEDGIEKLTDRLNTIKKKNKKTKKADEDFSGFVKDAQKIVGVKGTYVTVPLLISGIARVCINGTVSAGHDITELFDELTKKYKLNDREKSEVKWLLFDMGYPLRGDRGFMPDEEYDTSSSDNFDFAANYKG
jgi:hypothetical protein